jgi:hypothetical protein
MDDDIGLLLSLFELIPYRRAATATQIFILFPLGEDEE